MHIQVPPPRWLEAAMLLPDYSLIKSVSDAAPLKEAKEKWISLGHDPKKLYTVYRHFGLEPSPIGSWDSCVEHWKSNFSKFVDKTWLEQYAPFVDFCEDCNEYTAESTWTDAVDKARCLMSMEAAAYVWNTFYRGKHVVSSDGGEGDIPVTCKFTLMCGSVGNKFPIEVFKLSVKYDAAINYHSYMGYYKKVRWQNDFRDNSGLWDTLERQYGIYPEWVFGEVGPFLNSPEGWRSQNVLDGDRNLLVKAFQDWVHDMQLTRAYREGRLKGVGAWYTLNAVGDGQFDAYRLSQPEISEIATMLAGEWKPGEYDMDAVLRTNLLTHLNAMKDLLGQHTLSTLTNQNVLNLFDSAFGPGYYDLVVKAGLANLANHRQDLYTGPAVEDMTLSDSEKAQLISKL